MQFLQTQRLGPHREHFLLHCLEHHDARDSMLLSLARLGLGDRKLNSTLLLGGGKRLKPVQQEWIAKIVQAFMRNSSRFEHSRRSRNDENRDKETKNGVSEGNKQDSIQVTEAQTKETKTTTTPTKNAQ